MPENEQMTEEKPVTTLAYIGRRNMDGKTVHAFRDVSDTSNPDKVTWFPKAKATAFKSCTIGHIYAVPGEYLPKFWPSVKVDEVSAEEKLAWQARDRDIELASRSTPKAPELDALLADLRRARGAIPFSRRLAFDLWILEKIR